METTSNNKRRALGRGLEELFYNEPIDYNKVEEKILTETPKDEIKMVKIDELRSNPYQPRKVFDETALQELAASIKEHGVFQPIIIKKSIAIFLKIMYNNICKVKETYRAMECSHRKTDHLTKY